MTLTEAQPVLRIDIHRYSSILSQGLKARGGSGEFPQLVGHYR